MKIIIDTPIVVDFENTKDQLDFADYLEDNGINFYHAFGWRLVIEKQEIVSTVEFREEFFDRLDVLGINILLERIGHSKYRM